MSEDGISAYVLDESGNPQEIEGGAQVQQGADYWDEADERPGHHDDGSRMWRFLPQADPRSWGELTYIDEHIDEVKTLGWIEDNPEGNHWTVDEAIQAHETWAAVATEPYRTVVDDEGQVHVDPYVPVAERPAAAPMDLAAETVQAYSTPPAAPPAPPAQAVPAAPPTPPAPPTPAGPQWQRPEDRNPEGTGYGDVMDELRQRVPENDGRWTATQAAQAYGDQQFLDEQGITAAQDAAMRAGEASVGPDGVADVEGYNRAVAAGADLQNAYAATDSTRNRYQQSTDFRPSTPLDQQQREIAEQAQAAQAQAAADPASLGLGMTADQQRAYADAQEYAGRTGQQLDPAVPLNAEQQAWLDQVRQAELAQAETDSAAWQASEEGQRQAAAAERQSEFARTEQERVEASRLAAEQRMGRNG